MKTVTRILIGILLLTAFTSCFEENCWIEQEVYRPVMIHPSDLKDLIKMTSAKSIQQIGRINYYQDHIFIADPDKGVHVIDIQDPSQPEIKYFLEIPGLGDLGIQNDILYASQYTDLVALNIQDLENPQEVNRNAMAFNNFTLVNDSIYLGAKATGETQMVPCYSQRDDWCFYNTANDVSFLNENAPRPNSGSSPINTGLAGSLATFALTHQQVLYTLSQDHHINAFDLKNDLQIQHSEQVSWNAQTLFPYKNQLFVGTREGMIIFSIENPFYLEKLSEYQHWVSCDPVVVDDKHAYLTLRNGSSCRNGINQLEVINIEDPTHPVSQLTYPMTNPHGLGLGSQESLFVCDGSEGLKVFDKKDAPFLDPVAHFPSMQAHDVIALPNTLILIAEEGLFLYDYSDIKNMTFLSSINFN